MLLRLSLALALLTAAETVHALVLSEIEIQAVGDKIWNNECAGSIKGLTHWNKGEDFGSFGIGHFIWYPEGKSDRFQESFPDLLHFLKEKEIVLPSWLLQAKGCPWKTREAFYEQFDSTRMVELRDVLYRTRSHQALFIALRLEKSLPEMINGLPDKERQRVAKVFERLSNDPKGVYALIDYANFKGMGVAATEAYRGQGWGLLQVLKKTSPSAKDIVAAFAESAKQILIQRVKNSPPDRNEERWLKGWLNRIESYNGQKGS